jgi:alpha-tubulin suppressor-like RCC1 family protein
MVMGASSKGALGLGDDTEKAKEVVCLTGFNGIKVEKVVCGSEFNVAIDSAGQVYSWGLNNYGQLGNTSKLTNSTPKILHGFGGKKVIDVACGDTFCLALTSEGEVFSWGCGSSGQLGQGNSMDLSAPRKISTPWRAVSISCGEAHAGTVNESGQLFMFGSGRDGQIGRGSHSESPLSNRLQPVLVDFFDQRGLRVEKVVCGGNQSFAFASAGSLAGETAKGGAKK